MHDEAAASPPRGGLDSGIEIEDIHAWLDSEIEWPTSMRLIATRVGRVWPGRNKRLMFELALSIEHESKKIDTTLQGGIGDPPGHWPPCRAVRLTRNGLAEIRLACSKLQVWVCTPDRDRKLRVARSLLDPRRALDILVHTSSECRALHYSPSKLICKLMSYRITKRCVVLIGNGSSDSPPPVFAKGFRRLPSHRWFQNVVQLGKRLSMRTDGIIRIPSMISFLPDPGVVVTTALPTGCTPCGTHVEDHNLAAYALAALHQTPAIDYTTQHGPGIELETLTRWRQAMPRITKRACPQLDRLLQSLITSAGTLCTSCNHLVHRDFYPAQLYCDDGMLWITDFDTLTRADTELDIATYLAHLTLDGLTAATAGPSVRELAEAFLARYEATGGVYDEPRLRFYLACAIGRVGAIHLARGLADSVVDRLWSIAVMLVDSSTELLDPLPTVGHRSPTRHG